MLLNVMWPPSYYVMRDRLPFFLTLVYMHQGMLPDILNEAGYVMVLLTCIGTCYAGYLFFLEDSMVSLAGIDWSAPSPIQWGLFIILATMILNLNDLGMFESYYLAFISAFAGGWVYEFIPTLFHGFNYFAFFKINASKVFFMEFQLLCIPILVYVVGEHYKYKASKWVIPTALVFLFFSVFNQPIMAWFRATLNYNYRWVVRLPTISLLLAALKGVSK